MTHFYSCDWGTTSFRLRRVNAADGVVLGERRDSSGAKTLASRCPAGDLAAREEVFANFLREQLRMLAGDEADLLNDPAVIVSGMASSSVGWRELPYARVPVDLEGEGIVSKSFDLELVGRSRARMQLISGLRSETDMMRGEETEIIGLFAEGRYRRIADAGLVVLPGTHSKHVQLHQRRITGLQTFMTGELFEVLTIHSLLRTSVEASASASLSDPASRVSFEEGVWAASSPGLAGSLFQTRIRAVLHGLSPVANRWFLSGLLIGSELTGLATRETEVPILLAAPEPLSAAYQFAFETLGLAGCLTVVPPAEMSLASVHGHLVLIRRSLQPALSPR